MGHRLGPSVHRLNLDDDGDRGLPLAILFNGLTPYNVHFAGRLATELPDVRLHTIFSKGETSWKVDLPAKLNAFVCPPVSGVVDSRWVWLRWSDLLRAGRMYRHLRAHGVRALIIGGYSSLLHLRLIRLCRAHGIYVFLRGDSNIQGDRPRGFIHRWVKQRIVRWAIRQCRGVMPMGAFGRRYFERYGADPAWSFLVPFEPDYEYFAHAPAADVQGFRDEHGLVNERRRLIYCGRLVSVKRVDLLIDAFTAVAGRRAGWDLLIAGEGLLRPELESRVPDSIKDRVKWLGFCDVQRLRLAYHASHVMVLPSDYEPWAVVVNEAIAAGLVVVASDVVGAAHELVKEGGNGAIFSAGSVDALTQSLLDVTDPARYEGYRSQVASVLRAWRTDADPVEGVRRALQEVGLMH